MGSIRLIWLQAFIALHEEKTISAAARSIDVDRTAIRRYIVDLESWLNQSLIKLEAPHYLTPLGIEFLPGAKRIVEFMFSYRRLKTTSEIESEKNLQEVKKAFKKARIDARGAIKA